MKFGLIIPRTREVAVIECHDLDDAIRQVDLDRGKVDYAVVGPGVAIVVDEFSLMIHPSRQIYYALGLGNARRRLYGGNAVLYGFDRGGATTSVDDTLPLHVTWMATPAIVEDAIANGVIERPAVRVNGIVTWEWRADPVPRSKMH